MDNIGSEVDISATPSTTDVSRSGRVRKKNSLLAEYESLDEIEPVKRGRKSSESKVKVRWKKQETGVTGGFYEDHGGDLEMDLPTERNEVERGGPHSPDIVDRTNGYKRGPGRPSLPQKQKATPPVIKKEKEAPPPPPPPKPNKQKEQKEEKAPRVTAYTLWLKDQREMFSKKYPHLDSSSLSKKLSEMWQTVVPVNQKKLYKNKADKLMKKNLNIKNSAPVMFTKTGKKRGRPRIHPLPDPNAPQKPTGRPPGRPPKHNQRVNGLGTQGALDDNAPYKVTGTAPIDVAAHFALLGESLSIMGKGLMNAEKQPENGNLSVLMDSLICAVTPLVCLTQQVPQLNCIPQERLTRMMDHIAHIMPGL